MLFSMVNLSVYCVIKLTKRSQNRLFRKYHQCNQYHIKQCPKPPTNINMMNLQNICFVDILKCLIYLDLLI